MDAWSKEEYVVESERSEFFWLKGFFHVDPGYAIHKKWWRNYQELYTRDVAVMALGDIGGKAGLDIGGGDGTYAVVLSWLGARMSVQDLSANSIDRGKTLARKLKIDINFIEGSAVRLGCADSSLDFCFSSDFFEHISKEQKRAVISEIFRVLKPGGIAVVKTPNLSYLRLVINLKRLLRICRFQSPNIHIAHTKNNPDNEHHGLTTFRELESLFEERHFLPPQRFPLLLRRKYLPRIVARWLHGKWWATEHIILRYQKSYFVPIGDSLP